MTTIDTDELLARFDWLTDEDFEIIAEHPSLAAFLEEDDEEIVPAIERWTQAQTEAKAQLRQRGEQAHARMVTASGLLTTAIDPRRERGRG